HPQPGSLPGQGAGEQDLAAAAEQAPEGVDAAELDAESLSDLAASNPQDYPVLRAYESLRRNHRALLRSYSVALDTLAKFQQDRSDLHGLAAWALRTSSSGWALIHHGDIRVTNFAFDRLDKAGEGHGGWREVDRTPGSRQGSGTACSSLRVLALSQ